MATPSGFKFLEPRSYREIALEALDRLRETVDKESVADAAEQTAALQTIIQNWQRTTTIATAKTWIDNALQEDLLLFNHTEADQHLKDWLAVLPSPDDTEHARYQKRVEERAEQKQVALYVHGVITYCDSLLTKAGELEHGDTPPHPDFLLANYYHKARAIAEAARTEHDSSPELGVLFQKAERIQSQKTLAAKIYLDALTKNNYTEALYDLNQLPAESLVPRFAYEPGSTQPSFHAMVSLSQARREILAAAQEWAHQQALNLLQSAQAQLDAHEPQTALDLLDGRSQLQPYLKDEQRLQLEDLQKRADEELFKRTQAHERAQYALQVVSTNPLDAWDAYAQAYTLYQWIPELPSVREKAVAALAAQLDGIIAKTDQTFYDRQMDQVRQICQNTIRIYGNKDPLLDEKLNKLRELEEMTRQYEEYLANATGTYQQIKTLLYDDAVAANDLLTQLESYPDLVLLSFPDMVELREVVNRRLNADQVYGQLFGNLYTENRHDVEAAINAAKDALAEFPDDPRFRPIADALALHTEFLQAQERFEAGLAVENTTRLHRIAATDHPDRNDAIRLLEAIRRSAEESVQATNGEGAAELPSQERRDKPGNRNRDENRNGSPNGTTSENTDEAE